MIPSLAVAEAERILGIAPRPHTPWPTPLAPIEDAGDVVISLKLGLALLGSRHPEVQGIGRRLLSQVAEVLS